jgi:hypothetical protein
MTLKSLICNVVSTRQLDYNNFAITWTTYKLMHYNLTIFWLQTTYPKVRFWSKRVTTDTAHWSQAGRVNPSTASQSGCFFTLTAVQSCQQRLCHSSGSHWLPTLAAWVWHLADWRHVRNNLCNANHNGKSTSKITLKNVKSSLFLIN